MKKENLSKLILIRIDEEYISYLRKYDSKVQINSSALHKD
jgi:protein AbiQ